MNQFAMLLAQSTPVAIAESRHFEDTSRGRAVTEKINDLHEHLTKVQITAAHLCELVRNMQCPGHLVKLDNRKVNIPPRQHPRYPSPDAISGSRLE
ncbi:hypothetical protein AYL99_11024 [Fonsecaea erecta]|uniref:Uncharacterized protein n=1 Tax=Fonsecaea erecta TaxID=1367422 RepID=A0A178Z533_9EURO|nr:hypothetical protein AYL99_11024 [Fonsecaea erecta]OAP54576.1 hypothetical protein AYL99_11024 [Fonsecaea erecta]